MRTGLDALNELQGDWSGIKRIIPYGYGAELKNRIHRILQDFEVPFIVDSNPEKWGENYRGVEVVSPDRIGNLGTGDKVLVCLAGRARGPYEEIKGVLESYGLRENIDFCRLSQFTTEWYYRYRQEYCIYMMDMALSTACTLRCRNCNMFVPHYKTPVMVSFEEARRSIDLLMGCIDYLFGVTFLGGEAFLNPNLEKILHYVNETYSDKIGQITIATNGVNLPNQCVIDVLRREAVHVVISNYTDAIGAKSHVQELSELLKENDIHCSVLYNRIWCRTGFPEHPWDVSESEAKRHMLGCNGWRGLNDGKYYFCNIAWSAERAGLFQLQEGDYIDLEKLPPNDAASKRALLEFSLGKLPKEYMSFCKVCGGCGEDNQDFVLAGEQD